ncbi:hypothetical protein [Salinimonas sediminis]|nr:hypothetical protein [Salinimonas sediminis]
MGNKSRQYWSLDSYPLKLWITMLIDRLNNRVIADPRFVNI